jgi:hypothetical protein
LVLDFVFEEQLVKALPGLNRQLSQFHLQIRAFLALGLQFHQLVVGFKRFLGQLDVLVDVHDGDFEVFGERECQLTDFCYYLAQIYLFSLEVLTLAHALASLAPHSVSDHFSVVKLPPLVEFAFLLSFIFLLLHQHHRHPPDLVHLHTHHLLLRLYCVL